MGCVHIFIVPMVNAQNDFPWPAPFMCIQGILEKYFKTFLRLYSTPQLWYRDFEHFSPILIK